MNSVERVDSKMSVRLGSKMLLFEESVIKASTMYQPRGSSLELPNFLFFCYRTFHEIVVSNLGKRMQGVGV